MQLDNLALFLRIIAQGSLAAAGRERGLSPATVSERLAALEAHYGARLLNRTTRAISLTEEGRVLAQGAQSLLADAEELETRVKLGTRQLAGLIRLSAPCDLGRHRIAAVLDAFQQQHPKVVIDLHLSDGYVDVVAQGIDLAIRYGDLPDSTLMVRPLASNRRIVCASADYLQRHGTPQTPQDLQTHSTLLMRFGDEVDPCWPFRIEGKSRRINLRPARISNDGDLIRQWCLDGHGIARKSEWDIAEDLAAGRLVPLLQQYETAATRLQVVYPPGRARTRRIQLLLEALQQAFGQPARPGHEV